MGKMNVQALKELLVGVPDDTCVVVGTPDHSYKYADFEISTGLINNRGVWTEDFGEDQTPELEYGVRVPILIVS